MADDIETPEDDTEDTSSEENTEGEDSDSTEEEGSEDQSEESTEEAESIEGEDIKQYLDLNKVPPQLKESAARMLKGLSKAHQKLRADFEGYKREFESSLSTQFSQQLVQAKALQQLANLPEFKQFYADLQSSRPYGFSSVYNRSNGESPKGNGSDNSVESGGVSVETVMKALLPQIQGMIENAVTPLRTAATNTVWDSAEKNLPNFGKYKAHITALIQDNPKLTLEQAYTIAAGKDIVNDAVAKALKEAKTTTMKLKNNRTEKPSSGNSGGKVLAPRAVKNIAEAITLARRQSTVGG